MPTYSVTLAQQVTQCVDVEADCITDAIEAAEAIGMDQPNISNRFDASGDPYPVAVYNGDGDEVWVTGQPDG